MVQLKFVTTTLGLLFSWLYTYYTAMHSSYHIGEPSLIPKLLRPCVYDTMIMQFYYLLVSYYIHALINATCAGKEAL